MTERIKGSRITSRARKALNKLPMKRRIYVQKRAEGLNITESAKEVGISRRHAQNYESAADVQKAYRELMQKVAPMKEVVKLIKGGMHATMPVYSPDGKKKKDRPDWRTRKPYIEMVREDAGYIEDKKVNANATMISVTVSHIGANQPSEPTGSVTIKAAAQAE